MTDANPLSDQPIQPIAQSTWLMFISVYATQYLGLAFIMASTVAILRQLGIPLDKIAIINVIALPIFLKIFFAPFVDFIRPTFGFLTLKGQYRSWLLLSQLMMVIVLLLIGFYDVVEQFSTVVMLMLVYGFAVSFQDVAIDGLACKIVSEAQHKTAVSIQFASNLLGNVIGGGVLLITYTKLGWQGSFVVLALLTSVAGLQVFLFTEPENALTPEPLDNKRKLTSFWRGLSDFFTTHKAWFGLLAILGIGSSASFSLINPLLVDANWSLADIGMVTKVFGSFVGIFSAISAGWLIKQFGKDYALLYLTMAQTISLLLLLPLSMGHTSKSMVYLAVGVYFLFTPALIAVTANHVMDKASKYKAKASFFTLQIGFGSFVGFVYAGIAMAVAKSIGYSLVMWGGFGIGIFVCAIVYAYTISQKHHAPMHDEKITT